MVYQEKVEDGRSTGSKGFYVSGYPEAKSVYPRKESTE
jgi:hypothetical protein